MFTGLVREFGKVKSLQGAKLSIQAKHKANIGDSIAVNGACLTVIALLSDGFVVELSEETQAKVALESYQGFVHIEPAMRLSDRLDGHIVQGHIDGIGVISAIKAHSVGKDFFVDVDSNILALCIPKGSIALNGISLTINAIYDSTLRLTLIPHTLHNTLFSQYQVGTRLNIEKDCLARMVKHFLESKMPQSKQCDSTLSWDAVDRILGSY